MSTTFEQILYDLSNKSVVSFCAVVGCDMQFAARFIHPVLPEQNVCTPRSDYRNYPVACTKQRPCDREDRCNPDAAAHTHHGSEFLDCGWVTKRSRYVGNRTAGSKRCKLAGCLPDLLEDQGDRASLYIKISDRERYALSVLVDS